MLLYDSQVSGNCYKVRLLLAHLGLAYERRQVDVVDRSNRRELLGGLNPALRVPTLVLDDGETLVESAMILDWLDEQVGPQRALLPASGPARRQALTIMALATGVADKGIHIVIERAFRPEEKRHAPWTDRCRVQVGGGLAELDRLCAAAGERPWLLGDAMTQADITLACYTTYLRDAVPLELSAYPSLEARVERSEALPVFQQFHVPFYTPVPNQAQSA